MIAAFDLIDDLLQRGIVVVIFGDQSKGGVLIVVVPLDIHLVEELVSESIALQLKLLIQSVQTGVCNSTHPIVIGQSHGAAFVNGLHHIGFGFGLGLRAGRTAATAAGGQEQKGQYTGQKQGSQLSQFCHVGRLQSFLFW